jgi:hypothetical protein
VVEVTTTTLNRKTTAGVSDQDVLGDFDKLVDEVAQIDGTIGSLRTTQTKLTGAPASSNRVFYPLLVVTEGFPVNPLTLSLLREKVRKKGLLAGADVAQLEVVDLVELEMLEALSESGGPGIAQILAKKRGAALRNCSVRDFILRELNLRPDRPKRLENLWPAPFNLIAEAFGVDRSDLKTPDGIG